MSHDDLETPSVGGGGGDASFSALYATHAAGCRVVLLLEDSEEAFVEALLERPRGSIDCPACLAERELVDSFHRAARPSTYQARFDDEQPMVRRLSESVAASLRDELAEPVRSTESVERTGSGIAGVEPHPGSRRTRPRRRQEKSPPSRASSWQLIAAAAAVLTVVALGLMVSTREPQLTAPVTDDVLRSASIAGLSPSAEVAELPIALRCEAVAGASLYVFRVTTGDGSVVFDRSSRSPRVEFGPARSLFEPYVRYSWTVAALNAEGEEIARSAEAHFEVRPSRRTAEEEG